MHACFGFSYARCELMYGHSRRACSRRARWRARHVILNRPAKLNAINREMARRLADEMNALAADVSVKCVLVRGSGKAFCPGADIGEFEDAGPRARRQRPSQPISTARSMRSCSARIRSSRSSAASASAAGSSSRRCATCASRRSARFGIPVNRIGLTVDYSELAPIYRLIGEGPRWRSCSKGACSSARRR